MTTLKLETFLFVERHHREKEKVSHNLEKDVYNTYNQQNST